MYNRYTDGLIFTDRRDGGRQLASKLEIYKDMEGVLVLALPRGGVVIGYEVASYLNCPLDVIIVMKLGLPGRSELAIGAISETGIVVLNKDVISSYGIQNEYIMDEILRQDEIIEKRVNMYRKGERISDLKGKIVILVDDGAATGATMKVAISTLKAEDIKKLIVAIPVAPPDTAEELRPMVDELICLNMPYEFLAVGEYYQNFEQITDKEVVEILVML